MGPFGFWARVGFELGRGELLFELADAARKAETSVSGVVKVGLVGDGVENPTRVEVSATGDPFTLESKEDVESI